MSPPTSKERVSIALRHEEPDRVPVAMFDTARDEGRYAGSRPVYAHSPPAQSLATESSCEP